MVLSAEGSALPPPSRAWLHTGKPFVSSHPVRCNHNASLEGTHQMGSLCEEFYNANSGVFCAESCRTLPLCLISSSNGEVSDTPSPWTVVWMR